MIQDSVALLAFMFVVVAFTRWLEGKFAFVEKISSAVVCTLLGIALANIGVIPFTSPTHQAVYEYAIPYSIVLVILGSNMGNLVKAGRPIIIAYLVAVLGSFLGGLGAGLAMNTWVGPETWKLSGAFAGAFSGGGMNFAAVGRGLEITPSTFAAAAVADNLSTVPYILAQIGLFGLLGAVWVRRVANSSFVTDATAVGSQPVVASVNSDNPTGDGDPEPAPTPDARKQWTDTRVSITDLAMLGALPLAVLWTARQLSQLLPAFPEVLWLTTLALAIAQLPIVQKLRGAAVGAYFALHVFFIVLGSSSILTEVVEAGLPIVLFMILIIGIHATVVFGVGWLIRIDLPTICVASQAAIGGPGSALALAMAMGWHGLVAPGIIVGIFGYALGNYLGFGCAYLLEGLLL